jgi:LysM repeat protein
MKTNTPNPLVPQGTFLTHRKSHVRIAVFSILALHLILLGALLLQGCKRTADSGSMQQTNASITPEFDQATNVLAVAPAPLPPPLPVEPVSVAQTQATPPPPIPYTPPQPTTVRSAPVNHVPAVVSTVSNQPAEPAGGTTHVVLKGENFYTIGKKYGVSAKAIAKANPRIDAKTLKVGDKLTIPAAAPAATPATTPGSITATHEGTVYAVKSGDSLSTIAKHFGTTIAALRTANGLKTDKLKVGDKLKIPAAVHADNTSTSSPPRYP